MNQQNATEQDMDAAAAKGYIIKNWRTPYEDLDAGTRTVRDIQRFAEGRGVSGSFADFINSEKVLERYNSMAPFPIERMVEKVKP